MYGSFDPDVDDDSSDTDAGKGKGKGGRPSNDTHNKIHVGFETIDSLFSKLSMETNLSVDTIRGQYHKRIGAYSDWNAYGSYFVKNQEQELGRLPADVSRDGEYSHFLQPSTNVSTVSTIIKLNAVRAQTWKLFKAACLDYSEYLQTWKECKDISGGSSLQWRHRSFNWIAANMRQVVRTLFQMSFQLRIHQAVCGENLYGFHSFIGVVGDVIGSDQSLGHVYVSPGLEGLLENSGFGNKEMFEDHLKTWA